MKNRRKSRELALQVLYSLHYNGNDVVGIFSEPIFDKAKEDIKLYAKKIVAGVSDNNFDDIISKYSLNWSLKRISVIDHLILKIALFEMIISEDIPPVVAINEAIDLAKKYSNDDSKNFINGILGTIYKNGIIKN